MKKILYYFLILLIVSCNKSDDVAPGTLIEKTVAPDIGTGSVGFSIGSRIFAGLGAIGFPPTGGGNNKFYEYFSETNEWKTRSPLPTPFKYKTIPFVTENQAFVCGGYNNTFNSITLFKDVWEYNSQQDKWIQKKNLPIDSATAEAIVVMNVNKNAYLLCKDKLWIYEPAADIWLSKPNLPFGTQPGDYGLITSDAKGYVCISKMLWEYDTNAEKWVQLRSLDKKLLFCLNGKGYYAAQDGKADDTHKEFTYLWEYELATGNSRKKIDIPPMNITPHQTYIGVACTVANKAYFTVEYRTYMRNFYEFTP